MQIVSVLNIDMVRTVSGLPHRSQFLFVKNSSAIFVSLSCVAGRRVAASADSRLVAYREAERVRVDLDRDHAANEKHLL